MPASEPGAKKTKMKKNLIRYLAAVACCFCVAGAHADKGSPCLVFTGEAEKERVFDLKEFNRITFGEHSIVVLNSADPASGVELPYTEYNRIAFDSRDLSGIGDVSVSETASFRYDRSTSSLSYVSDDEAACRVGVFSANGVLVCHTTMYGGQSVSLEALAPGMYIAVATVNNNVQKIKFVK